MKQKLANAIYCIIINLKMKELWIDRAYVSIVGTYAPEEGRN
jgi:hypothetical protein